VVAMAVRMIVKSTRKLKELESEITHGA